MSLKGFFILTIFLVLLLTIFTPDVHAEHTHLPCRAGQKTSELSVKTYKYLRSYLTVAGLRHYPWTGREATVSAEQLVAEFGPLEILAGGGEFKEFIRDDSNWLQGRRVARLYVEAGLFENAETARVIEVESREPRVMTCALQRR